MSLPRTYQFTLVTGPSSHNRLLKNVLLVLTGAAATVAYIAYRRRRYLKRNCPAGTTAFDVENAKETRAAVDGLLQSYYGHPDDVLLECRGVEGLRQLVPFPVQLGILCQRHCPSTRGVAPDHEEPCALDLGCKVGATSFELARFFPRVLGIDVSSACINAAQIMKERGWMRYSRIEEGELSVECTATVPPGIERSRVEFRAVTDMSALPVELIGSYHAVIMAQILCNVVFPEKLLDQLLHLVRPGGIAVVASSFDWLEDTTPRPQWLGGFKDKEGREVWTADTVDGVMRRHFDLITHENVPLLARRNRRACELDVVHVTVWQRRR